jgi:hypothetical protein
MVRLSLFTTLFVTSLASPVLALDYHLSASGDDRQDGAVPERAWRTIARAGRQTLRPGDRLLFRAGETFVGNLLVNVSGESSATAPITIGSYGGGKGIIEAGDGEALLVKNTGGVVIRDLVLMGKNRRTNRGNGVLVINTLPGGKRLTHVRIQNVEASSFGKSGIAVAGWPEDKSQSGFADVRITGCRAYDNAFAGIHVFGVHDYWAKSYAHREITVVDCIAHDNPGDPDEINQHSGNGILLHDVDCGCIDRCAAFGNGSLCKARGGGPVGIWAWSSRKLVIQNCVSVRNRTGGQYDGGGFDFDGGVSESIMQYNYSGENDGAGYLVFDFGAAPFKLADNVLRFNISENDGRKNGYGGITVNSTGAAVERLLLLHNVVSVSPTQPTGKNPTALVVQKSTRCRVYNNLFLSKGGCMLAEIGAETADVSVLGNHYWAGDDHFHVRHAGKDYRSLDAWRGSAGVERFAGKNVGSTGDPLLRGPIPGVSPMEAAKRLAVERFKLRTDSQLVTAGLDIRKLLGIDPGERDYWGNALPKDRPASVGAHAGDR